MNTNRCNATTIAYQIVLMLSIQIPINHDTRLTPQCLTYVVDDYYKYKGQGTQKLPFYSNLLHSISIQNIINGTINIRILQQSKVYLVHLLIYVHGEIIL